MQIRNPKKGLFYSPYSALLNLAQLCSTLQDKRDNKGSLDLATRTREKAETIYLLAKHELEPQRLKLVADQFTRYVLVKITQHDSIPI